jgi:hypothetical protein
MPLHAARRAGAPTVIRIGSASTFRLFTCASGGVDEAHAGQRQLWQALLEAQNAQALAEHRCGPAGDGEAGAHDRSDRAVVIPPGNRLEALKAERAGQYSVRVNDRQQICFVGGKEDRPMSGSSTITDPELLPDPNPGEILLEEFLRPMGVSLIARRRELGAAIEAIEPRAA